MHAGPSEGRYWNAWYPIAASVKADRMAPNVYLVLVVRLQAPVPRGADPAFMDTASRTGELRNVDLRTQCLQAICR